MLDVGSNAGYDPFMFHLRGAAYVLACEPFEFHEQALFLESVYRTGVDFQQIGWQDLDPEEHGTFDLVHCHGVLYHELHPMAMLAALAAMLAPGRHAAARLDDARGAGARRARPLRARRLLPATPPGGGCRGGSSSSGSSSRRA